MNLLSKLPRRSVLRSGVVAGALVACPAVLTSRNLFQQSLEAMIGQMLIVGFWGDRPGSASAEALKQHLKAGQAGGVLFLRHNVKTFAGATRLAKEFVASNNSIKVLTAIDQEGGFVQRLGVKQGFSDIPTAQQLSRMDVSEANRILNIAAREMARAGFNMNLAPSLDFQMSGNPVIGKYGRGFGTDADTIEPMAHLFIKAFENQGVRTVLKHFPGHGTSRGDSHDGFVDISQSWSASEMEPFKRHMKDASAIMTAHLYHENYNEDGAPISLSRSAVTGLLQDQLGYRGVVMTDDLDMAAIAKHYTQEAAIIRSINAGSHLLLISNSADPRIDFAPWAVGVIKKAVDEGAIRASSIQTAASKIASLKARF